MKPDQRDAAYLWDMLDAARTVRQICDGLNWTQYASDRKTQLATERLLEIIGEAAAEYLLYSGTPTLKSRGAKSLVSETSWPTNMAKSNKNASGRSSLKISQR
ncbi:MAG TPA: hypothetical protein P5279_05490 [Anaerohalosphaeraceae bacterium]|jgi:hypothetical protein|nr:hypothetical protein [Anaerohalosphaeraceae bacterium]HRT49924.1 hypothetical protein [Anaerohalosphaeraceae bacterium]HRT85778.1 hypothetical protein [Anaerohalosphaeraceae bacterium]